MEEEAAADLQAENDTSDRHSCGQKWQYFGKSDLLAPQTITIWRECRKCGVVQE